MGRKRRLPRLRVSGVEIAKRWGSCGAEYSTRTKRWIDMDQSNAKTFHGCSQATALASSTIDHSFHTQKQLRRHHASVHNRSSSGRMCGFDFDDSGFGRSQRGWPDCTEWPVLEGVKGFRPDVRSLACVRRESQRLCYSIKYSPPDLGRLWPRARYPHPRPLSRRRGPTKARNIIERLGRSDGSLRWPVT
jgi:hypothetical protein